MRVSELAKDLGVEVGVLLKLLRSMRISASGGDATVSDSDVAIVRARVERERRAGHDDPTEAVEAAIEDTRASRGTGRRRRRRRAPESEPDEVEAEDGAEEEEETEDAGAAAEADDDELEAEEETELEETELEEIAAEADDEVEDVEVEEEIEAELEDDEDEFEDEFEDEDDDLEEADEVDEEEIEADVDEDEEEEEEPEEELQKKKAPMSVRDLPETEARGKTRRIRRPTASAQPGGKVRIQAEGYTPDGRRERRRGKKGKKGRKGVDQDAVQENIQRVMAELKSGGGKKKKKRRSRPSKEEVEQQQQEQEEEQERERTTVRVNEFLSVSELAELVDVSPTEIIGAAFKNLGLMVTINQRLDFDQIELLLDEFGFTAVREEEYAGEEPEEEEVEDPEDLEPRPAVVTVMGHVDHGKTLLLDSIRKTNVVAGESGGITQHIGAYHVELPDGRKLSFLDTPGHAAFTAMRARGADITDVVILLVAADDSVMPQTEEAISHARNAGVPMVVAINKCDLPAANPDRVKQELLQHDVQVEEYGGQVLVSEISAKTGEGIDDLLEKVLLQAEILELKANPNREAVGTVIEAELDPGKGPVATVLIQKGTLHVGDSFIMGRYDGRVRAMLDERGKKVEEAGPSVPVQILGAGGVPQAGDSFQAMEADKAAEVAQTRQRLEREKQLRVKERGLKLGDFGALAERGEVSRLPLIIRGDVDGSVQALRDSLEQLSTSEVQVQVVHSGVGAINEEDVLLAETAGAVIIGFRVRPHSQARQLAERDEIDIHIYDVIYDAVDEIRAAMEGMLAPKRSEEVLGAAEVREIFKITGAGTIAGCYVTEGVIERKHQARLIRDGVVIYDGDFGSLKRFKDDVKEVREGFECGIGIENFNDIKVGDLIECYKIEETARTLADSKASG